MRTFNPIKPDVLTHPFSARLALLGLLALLCCLPRAADAQIQVLGGTITSDEIRPEAFPASQLSLDKPVISHPAIVEDPFNSYVPSLSLTARLNLHPYLELPYAHFPYLRKGQAPRDRADIALASRLFVDFAVSGYATFSDNIERTADNRTAGMIYGGVLSIDSTLQITDDLQMNVAGNLAYYYADGQGYTTSDFGFNDSFYFDDTFRFHDGISLDGKILFLTQCRWTREIGELELEIYDRFFADDRVMERPFTEGAFSRARELVNVATIRAGYLLPSQTRAGLGYNNVNYWYNSRFNEWNRQENRLTAWLSVERDSMRFRPFADYTLSNVEFSDASAQDGWVHEGHAGFQGPITENMNAEASAGYARSAGDNPTDEILWRLYIDHLMNSKTRHQMRLERSIRSSPDTTIASLTEFQYQLGRRIHRNTTLWLGGKKSIFQLQDQEKNETENWGLLASVSFEPAKNMTAGINYEYINWSATDDDAGDDFFENRVTITLAWDI